MAAAKRRNHGQPRGLSQVLPLQFVGFPDRRKCTVAVCSSPIAVHFLRPSFLPAQSFLEKRKRRLVSANLRS